MLVLADDLTGALDTSVKFKTSLNQALVLNSLEDLKAFVGNDLSMNIISLNTNSRNLDQQSAYELMIKYISSLKDLIGHTSDFSKIQVYKKIDSTLRGNISGEIAAFLDTNFVDKIIFCSANPEQKRVVVDGFLYVDGKMVEETPSGKDPFSSVSSSSVVEIINAYRTHKVAHISLRRFEKYDYEDRTLRNVIAENQIISFDAITQAHLGQIIRLYTEISKRNRVMLCGSAGLADALSKERVFNNKRILVISGSLHPVSMSQMDFLINKDSSIRHLEYNPEHSVSENIEKVIDCLRDSRKCSFRTFSVFSRERKNVMNNFWINLGKRLSSIENLILVINGGETASLILEGMEQSVLNIDKEIIEGSVMSWTEKGNIIITKSGGFGTSETLHEIIRLIGGESFDSDNNG
ncbi:four-carbon acid sugar kinase family protein [Kosmotoga pacifica]|uniref:Four-carbon acid sugar kinase family protein n=1 Tax=Kosmotoga pacifica TaxID=1330330 RepID=A0A0G2Z764_9BACT|nr:four-carbon acid sugar kinase family protein [Kosmotoga pacifica]AKI97402.1 hypothetical protein IX53_05745 [Kosmotoga pacifica]